MEKKFHRIVIEIPDRLALLEGSNYSLYGNQVFCDELSEFLDSLGLNFKTKDEKGFLQVFKIRSKKREEE